MNKEVETPSNDRVRRSHLSVSAFNRMWCIVILIIVIFAIAIITLWFCLRIHWWLISLAALIIIAGTALSLLFEEWKERNWRKWCRAVFIGIVIAVGTFVTTYGWNLRDNYLHDRDMLIAAVTELRLNKTYIHVQSQRRNDYLARGGHLSTPFFVSPTAREMRQLMTQATSLIHDKTLIHALTLYVMAADKLVPRLEHIDRLCSQPIATMEMKKKIVQADLGDGEDSAFQYFINAHKQLESILTSSYPWSLEEAEARLDKDLLEAIETTWLNVSLDPNKPRN